MTSNPGGAASCRKQGVQGDRDRDARVRVGARQAVAMTRFGIIVLLSICVRSTGAQPANRPASAASDSARIRTAIERGARGFERGMPDSILAHYAPDVILSYPGIPDQDYRTLAQGYSQLPALMAQRYHDTDLRRDSRHPRPRGGAPALDHDNARSRTRLVCRATNHALPPGSSGVAAGANGRMAVRPGHALPRLHSCSTPTSASLTVQVL